MAKKKGKRIQIMVNGQRASKVCYSREEAIAWEAQKRAELLALAGGQSITHTVRDIFEKYAREVSPGKRGSRWEFVRLDFLCRDALADVKLSELNSTHIAQWRDRRLKEVSGSTVNRDLNLISHCFAIARDEWRWILESPTTAVRRPKEAPGRDVLISDKQIERLLIACGYDESAPIETVAQRVAVAFLFAIETAMRAGEICGLKPEHVKGRVAHLPKTKNGFPRDVPLSARALALWAKVPEGFKLTPSNLDANFRKLRDKAGVEGITFHDTRHAAITKLAKKLNILELARMTGHRDLKQLQRYFNESAETIAGRLD